MEAFQVQWAPTDKPGQRSAFVRVHADDGQVGIGEASPMQGGLASLDHAVLQDRLLHRLVKLGPEDALSGALAALDIALWDPSANDSALLTSSWSAGRRAGGSSAMRARFPSHRDQRISGRTIKETPRDCKSLDCRRALGYVI